jgi:hypothetical protein
MAYANGSPGLEGGYANGSPGLEGGYADGSPKWETTPLTLIGS